MIKIRDRFCVRTDAGHVFEIIERQHYIPVETHDSEPAGVIPGHKSLRTSDGGVVNFEGDNLYEILEEDVVARRVSN